MQHPAPTAADHAAHDRLAVAAYAAGDATGAELAAAMALVAACTGCASLHHDLRAIAAALPTTLAPVRPRDFRITPEQAAALRPTGWRRLLAPFAGPGFAFAGPLGSGLATLGLAGILVAGAVGLPLGGSTAGAPVAGGGGEVQVTAESPAVVDKVTSATSGPAALAPAPAASGIENGYVMGSDKAGAGNTSTAGPGVQAGTASGAGTEQPMDAAASAGPEAPVAGPAEARDAVAQTPVPLGAIVSGLALLAGLALLMLRLVGRQLLQAP